MTANVNAFVFAAEFENHQLPINAGVKYKTSLCIQLLYLVRWAGVEAGYSV